MELRLSVVQELQAVVSASLQQDRQAFGKIDVVVRQQDAQAAGRRARSRSMPGKRHLPQRLHVPTRRRQRRGGCCLYAMVEHGRHEVVLYGEALNGQPTILALAAPWATITDAGSATAFRGVA